MSRAISSLCVSHTHFFYPWFHLIHKLTFRRYAFDRLHNRESSYRGPGHILHPASSASVSGIHLRGDPMATKPQPAAAIELTGISFAPPTQPGPGFRPRLWRRDLRRRLRVADVAHPHISVHHVPDGVLSRAGARLRRQRRQYQHQLHPAGHLLLEDLAPGLGPPTAAR